MTRVEKGGQQFETKVGERRRKKTDRQRMKEMVRERYIEKKGGRGNESNDEGGIGTGENKNKEGIRERNIEEEMDSNKRIKME